MATVERLVLVHGSVVGGRATWVEQRRSIHPAEAELVVLERPGFEPAPDAASDPVPDSVSDFSRTRDEPPRTPVSDFSRTPDVSRTPEVPPRIDFEEHADWVAERVRDGDHLVGHSYGGVIALLTAALVGDRLASLTVVEPPATRVALEIPAVASFARAGEEFWATGPRDDPEAFLRGFLHYVGADFDPPSPLPPLLVHGARALIDERGPWEAEIPLARLAELGFPVLVVSGAHHPAFDAICDRLERELEGERLVLPGHGHNPQLDPAFTHALLEFVERAGDARAD